MPVIEAVRFEPTLEPHEVVDPPLTACHQRSVKFFIQDGNPEAVHFREKLLHVMVYALFTAPSAGCGLLEAQSPSVSRIVIANRTGVVLVLIASSYLSSRFL